MQGGGALQGLRARIFAIAARARKGASGTMVFSSVTFLFFFLPLVVALYFALPWRGARNAWLLAASLVFYSWGEGAYLLLLLGSIALNHAFSHLIARRGQPWLALGIAANLLLLVTFKYLGFLVESAAALLPIEVPGWAQSPDSSVQPDAARLAQAPGEGWLRLPLGISFFTFQAISLLVDVSRGSPPARSLFRTGLFISMFPQLIAGPIVRWDEIRQQIAARRESWDGVAAGTRLFILGLAQKVLIADQVSVLSEASFGTDPATLSTGAAWLGLAAFAVQIFFDFAGYSNMAIGMGRVFGFALPQNFAHPYSSASFQEFWRRWHMTLSRWFRDYLFIPLGGSRAGRARTYRNLLIVFVLCGLWHGAQWTFLLWGLWHGAFLTAERLYTGPRGPRVLGVIYTVLFVSLGWVLFRADSAAHAAGYWVALLPGGGDTDIPVPPTALYALAAGMLLSWDRVTQWGSRVAAGRPSGEGLRWAGALGLLVLGFAQVASSTHQPFLYFVF